MERPYKSILAGKRVGMMVDYGLHSVCLGLQLSVRFRVRDNVGWYVNRGGL